MTIRSEKIIEKERNCLEAKRPFEVRKEVYEKFEELKSQVLGRVFSRSRKESAHIKGVPPVLRISAFMHRHVLSSEEKWLQTQLKPSDLLGGKRVLAKLAVEAIMGLEIEVIERGKEETWGSCAPYARKYGITPIDEDPKGKSFAMDNVNIPPTLLRVVDTGEAKTVKQSSMTTTKIELMNCPVVVEAIIEGFRVRRIHVDGGSSSEVMYDHCFRNLSCQTRSRLREYRIPLVRFSREVSYPMGVIDLEVTMQIEEAQDLSRHVRGTDPIPMQTSSEVANPRVSLAPVATHSRRPRKEPMQLDDMEGRRQPDKGKKPPKSGTEEKIVVNDNYPEQLVTIRGGLSAECRHALIHTLRKNVDIFAWNPADMTGIPRAITEHSLDTYPHIEPKAQKKRSLALDRRKVVTDEVNKWLKADLNKACPKDLYPLPEIDWKIESLMGFQYKCFLDAYKGYHQIQMTKKDEEKTAFHTEEGVFCYTKMPFGLKNAVATYQRLVDSAFKEQIGVNLEAYVDDMVIKSRTEQDIIKDIEQTLSTLRRINMKLNPKKCSFGMEEGKFLGYIVTSEGIRANPEKAKAVMDMPSPKTLKQMQSLSGKLAALNHTLKKCTNKKDFRWTEAAEATFLEMKKLVSELPTLTTPKKGAETNYAPMEKLALALVHAARRLRRGITYVPRFAVKGQVLADFLADTPIEINSTPERLYTDGASNNEGSGAGLILVAPDDVEYSYALRLNFSNSNNDAEYEALLAGLRIAKEMQVKDIHTFVDSKLVASQVEGSYEAKGERMGIRDNPKKAKAVMDMPSPKTLKQMQSLSGKLGALNQAAEVAFLEIKKLVSELPTLTTPKKGETLMMDARELIRACDDCQAHASVPRLPKADMISVTSAWLFMKWGMDIVGPLPKGPRRVKYLIVAIDYFTKWMEAKPLAIITGKQVVNFTYDNIVCRFRIPATIITDQFVNDPFKKWTEKLKIQLISTSVYHPRRMEQ
ncbi:reverse transcriptase domain-containing protein [Tanacetum coccineum]